MYKHCVLKCVFDCNLLQVDGLSMDLDNSQKETRNASSELFRVKSAYEESVLQLDEVRRENRTLSTEIKEQIILEIRVLKRRHFFRINSTFFSE